MILCLDYGTRYIGMAATDQDDRITYRYGTIDQKQEDALTRLHTIVEKEKPSLILVGLPISLSGTRSAQTETTAEFIQKLRDLFQDKLPIEEIDETLTSIEAQKIIAFEGGSKDAEHAEAARLMLEEYLHTP